MSTDAVWFVPTNALVAAFRWVLPWVGQGDGAPFSPSWGGVLGFRFGPPGSHPGHFGPKWEVTHMEADHLLTVMCATATTVAYATVACSPTEGAPPVPAGWQWQADAAEVRDAARLMPHNANARHKPCNLCEQPTLFYMGGDPGRPHADRLDLSAGFVLRGEQDQISSFPRPDGHVRALARLFSGKSDAHPSVLGAASTEGIWVNPTYLATLGTAYAASAGPSEGETVRIRPTARTLVVDATFAPEPDPVREGTSAILAEMAAREGRPAPKRPLPPVRIQRTALVQQRLGPTAGRREASAWESAFLTDQSG